MRAVASLVIFGFHGVFGAIIPSDRLVDWSNAGVSGGIPDSSTMTVYTTLPAGSSASSVQSALNKCPSNQVVQLAAGDFAFGSTRLDWYSVGNGVVLRGTRINGKNATKITTSAFIPFLIRTGTFQESALGTDANLSADAIRGTTTITLASVPSWITVGGVYGIDQLNDEVLSSVNTCREGAGIYRSRSSAGSNGNRGEGETFKVVAKTATTITTEIPLMMTYTTARTAQIFKCGVEGSNYKRRIGVENIDLTETVGTSGSITFQLENCENSWIKNVQVFTMGGDRGIGGEFSYRCSVFGCALYDARLSSAGQGYAISLYDLCCWWRIENNIIAKMHVALQANYGSGGNVYAYNLCLTNTVGSAGEDPAINVHGNSAQFNLFEGNFTYGKAMFDCIHGSSSRNILFRNRILGDDPLHTYNQCAVDIDYWNRNCSVVGNILGMDGFHNVVTEQAPTACSDTTKAIYKLGYVNAWACDASCYDATNALSPIIHGNYDYVSHAQTWASFIPDHTVDKSLYLSAKPNWFGDRPWPPFDPANPSAATITNLPAGYRYFFGVEPPSGGPVNQPPVPVASASPTNGLLPLTVNFSSVGSSDPENATLTYSWSFGDGTTSTAANPSHTYQSANTYSAQLTVSDGVNSVQSGIITINVTTPVNHPPSAVASATPSIGVAPLTVTFSSAGSSDPDGTTLNYAWTFGDGATSTAANPSHTYQTASNYVARLTVSDGTNSTTSSNLTITVTAVLTNLPPVVVASATPLTGVGPLTVAFSSAGSSDPEGATLTYDWTFGDGASSTAANPGHTYQSPGTYLAHLTVSDGTNTVQSANFSINVTAPVNQPPTAVATASATNGVSPLVVTFSGAGSSDPEGTALTYNWTFGDGGTSTAVNPSHTYQAAGSYMVRLTVSDGTNAVQSTGISITVINPGSGLVAAYGFEEGNGSAVADTSGTGNAGTIVGGTWASGKFGKALAFNGTNAMVTINDSASLDLTSGMTLEAWVNPKTLGGWRDIIFKDTDIYFLMGSTPQGQPDLGGSFASANVYGTAALATNTWTHVAGTYDGTTMRFYVNGVEVASLAQTGTINTSSGALTIGGDASNGQYWSGLIDEVRIYDRALSATEIQADMNSPVVAGTAPPPSPPQDLRIALQ